MGKPTRKPNNKQTNSPSSRKDVKDKRERRNYNRSQTQYSGTKDYEDREDYTGYDKRAEKAAGKNDFAWLNNNPKLVESSSNFYFSNRLGDLPDFSYSVGSYTQSTSSTFRAFPGIMSIDYIPSIGQTTGVTSGGNPYALAGKNIYSAIRSANSGAKNYEWPDLIIALFAIKEIYACIGHMTRVYGEARLYDQQNAYLPDALIKCMGLDPSSVRDNLAQCHSDLNNLIARASVLWIPSDLPFVTRQFWANSDVYKDGKSNKAQLYLFNQRYTYQYKSDSTLGSSLQPIEFVSTTPTTWSAMIAKINALIDAVIDEVDVTIMMGDLMKYYGANKLFQLNMIDVNYTVVPVENYEVLTEIHNAVTQPVLAPAIVQVRNGNSTVDLRMDDGSTSGNTSGFPYNSAAGAPISRALFDTWITDPKPKDNIIAGQLSVLAHTVYFPQGTEAGTKALQLECATMIPTAFRCIVLGSNHTYNAFEFHSTISSSSAANNESHADIVSKFDWAPYIYSGNITNTNTNTGFTLSFIYGDIDNYTVLGPYDVGRMHLCALLSLYNIPYLPS